MKSINEYLQLLAVYMQTHASVYHIKRMGYSGVLPGVNRLKIATLIFAMKEKRPLCLH